MQPPVIEEAPYEPTIFPERQRQEPQRRCRPGHAAALRAPQRCRPEQPTLLINRPDVAPSGSGEPSIRPVAAAIANALFDATGVRIRRVAVLARPREGALSS